MGLVVFIAIGATTTGLFLARRNTTAPSEGPVSVQTPAPTPAALLLTWDDPAGFSFSYPEGLTVNKHDEDNQNYAHVELTSKDHPGSLIVWAKDTNSADVKAWVNTDKTFAGASVIDTTIGSQPAKKVTIASPEKRITGTIFDELLFMIETTLTDKLYWSGVDEQVAGSFEFTPTAGGGGGGDVAADEEETVQ